MKPSPDQTRLLDAYAALLRANSHGLLSKGDAARIDAHIADAATGLEAIESAPHDSLIDVGTGGGLPGIPLAILLPATRVTLLESQRKKTDFLAAAVEALELVDRVSVVQDRAEDAVKSIGRETIDVAVARALAAPPIVAEWLAPFVRVGGRMVMWTTAPLAEAQDLERSAETLGFAPPALRSAPSELRESGALLVWTKQRATPARFPRRAGDARRSPLV